LVQKNIFTAKKKKKIIEPSLVRLGLGGSLIMKKDLGITEVRGAKANISDLQVYGDGDTFALLCKASSQTQGWMKSTKVANVPGGCIVQVTTQQRNPDESYAVAEALTYVPGVHIDKESNPRKFIKALG
jgi:hypothetical protein